jgi:pimeloyl-ACP methyl ester carboxylesterase
MPPASSRLSWTPYEYKLKSGETIQAELGTIDVPLVRAVPDSGALTLRFVRLAAYPGVSGPPIIYLAGGPGSSGVEAGQGDRFRLFDRLRKHGDVILLDQRGIGMSSPPPVCSTPWRFPANAVATEATVNRSLEEALRACAAEWRAAGVRLEAFNTVDNAADVADLIRALGVPKARLVGISYGTFLGFALLRDHGSLIDRAIFAGTEGPDHTVKLPTQADAALAALSAEIASTPEGRAAAPDLAGSVKRVFARLAKAPVIVEQKGGEKLTISLYDAQTVTTFLMATSENAVRLPGLFRAMEGDDFSGMAKMVNLLRRFYGAISAMPYATDAASGASLKREKQAGILAQSSLFGNAVNFPSADIRAALGVSLIPKRYHSPLRTSVPALFISGTLDSRTPPANAEEVRRGFRKSTHLVIQGAGHDNDLFLSTPVILDRIDAFFSGKKLMDEAVPVHIMRF